MGRERERERQGCIAVMGFSKASKNSNRAHLFTLTGNRELWWGALRMQKSLEFGKSGACPLSFEGRVKGGAAEASLCVAAYGICTGDPGRAWSGAGGKRTFHSLGLWAWLTEEPGGRAENRGVLEESTSG